MSKKYEAFHEKMFRLFGGGLPKSVTLQITEDCNLRCSYCYQVKKSESRMSFETAKAFIDMILEEKDGINDYFDITKDRAIIFDLIGGEPFLEIELIERIVRYTLDKAIEVQSRFLPHIMFSFSTNGTLYFDERVQRFLNEFKDFFSLSISIDGDKELHDSCRKFPNGEGSYDIAMKGALDWISRGNYLGSKMTICPDNVGFLGTAVIDMLKNGYEDVRLNCTYEEGWTDAHARTLYFELKKIADYVCDNEKDVSLALFNQTNFKPMDNFSNENWCGGNGQMLALDYKGDVYPCLRYMASSLGEIQKPLCIGNVDDGLLNTKEACEINDCLKCITRRSQSTDECFDCPVASGCGWCTAYNYQVTGDPNKRLKYHCMMHKATSLANVYYWNKRHSKLSDCEKFKMNLPKEDAIRIVGENEYLLLKALEGEKL